MPFRFEAATIPEVVIVRPRIFPDDRGYFLETYRKGDFRQAGIPEEFVQDNHSFSGRGVLRGIHFQQASHTLQAVGWS